MGNEDTRRSQINGWGKVGEGKWGRGSGGGEVGEGK